MGAAGHGKSQQEDADDAQEKLDEIGCAPATDTVTEWSDE
jgi:hypothetical protein